MAALLWLRNHYDVGRPELKPLVLNVIDAIIDSDPPDREAMRRFRLHHPARTSKGLYYDVD
jgi:hypothetical protein